MSLETDLRTLLQLQCPRVFPDVAPIQTQRPYVTYQQIGGSPINYVSGEVPTTRHAMIQVNVWADSRVTASALALQIDAALRSATNFQCKVDSEIFAEHDEDLDRYGASQDFSIWAAR